MERRRHRQAPEHSDRTQQSARHIDNDRQERSARRRRSGWQKAGRIIGTLLLVFVLTGAIFAGIFSAYVNSSMRGKVEGVSDEFETKVSTELYYQEPESGESVCTRRCSWTRKPHLGQSGPDPQEPAEGSGGHRGQAVLEPQGRGLARHRPRHPQHPVRRQYPGRLHHHPAAGEERHRRQPEHRQAQGDGDLPGAGSGEALRKGRDPGGISQ